MKQAEDIAVKFTVNDEQALALDFRENTALRASAGSGKTRVLTKRFVRILLEETDANLDDIIAITFTRKAATEMKDRIRRELAIWLKTPPYQDNRRLADFRLRMSEARIDTIHGFLGKLIRRYFQVLGIDPGFTILEEVDTNVLISRFIDASISAIFTDPSQKDRLTACLTSYGAEMTEAPLRDAIHSLYQGMRCAGETVQSCRDRHRAFESRMTSSKKEPPAGLVSDTGISALEYIGLDLLAQLDARYRAYKDRENVLDFSDLELLACELLERPESRRSIQESFRHLMMDEFQDVNPLQMRIVNLLVRDGQGAIPPGRLFIVGDSKQSIYGFRGADHRVFGEACDTIARQGTARQLSNCYRCTDKIIQTVNGVFDKLMDAYEPLHLPRDKKGRPVELITWTSDDRKILKPSNRWSAYKNLIPDGSPEDTDKVLRESYPESVETNRMMLQGRVIAGRMAALNAEGVPYRDMAILLPSRTSLAAIENGLYSRDIPYTVLGGLGFWSQTEVSDILNLYRLIFQPQDRAALYAVLRSPLFSFSDDSLLKYRHLEQESKEKSLRPEVLLEHLSLATPEDPLFARAAGIFKRLLPLDGILGPAELFQVVIETTGYPEILILLPNGDKKIRNLEKLVQIVAEFSRKGGYTARDLPLYMDALQESGGMDAEAFLDNEDSEAVKILTIHASKGLEFPVVFLPSMDRAVDTMGNRFKPLLAHHPVNGIAAIGVEADQSTVPSLNPPYQEVFSSRLGRELEESRRLFYVAATRAQSHLVMIGEHQSAKEGGLEAQNSFIKQLFWALGDKEIPDSLTLLNAEKYLGPETSPREKSNPDEFGAAGYPVAAEDVANPYIASSHGTTAPHAMPAHRPSGLVSVSQWMSWRDCPRQYWLSRIIRMPGQSDVLTAVETTIKMAQDTWDDAAFHDSLHDSFQYEAGEATLEASANPSEPADESQMLDAARLGTWIHAQLQDIPLDRSGPFPVLGRCDLKKTRIPRWLESQKQHALHLLEGYNTIIDRAGESPAVSASNSDGASEHLVHSWSEFEFRIKASESLELVGVIDRLDIVDTPEGFRAVITDYKSNHIQDEHALREKADYYAIQLQVYAWAISRMPIWKGISVDVIRGDLYFLDAGQSVSVPVGHAQQELAVNSLIQALPDLLGLLKQDGYPMKEGDACTWCQQKQICEMLNTLAST